MGAIRVDADGLQALANECDQLSEDLAVSHAAQASGPAFQATTSAVNVINAGISAAVDKLAHRMSATEGVITYLHALRDNGRPGHQYVDISKPTDTLVLSRDEYV